MASERLIIPGAREILGIVDTPDTHACVVACAPHPEHGGNRNDPRLQAVGDALGDRGVSCVRFDYGPWDHGRGERDDAVSVVRWAKARYERVGVFGYSFGGGIAFLAAASEPVSVVSTLAPVSMVDGTDVTSAITRIEPAIPLQVVYGSRDTTVDSEPVTAVVEERNGTIKELPADHFFLGTKPRVGTLVSGFLADALTDPPSR